MHLNSTYHTVNSQPIPQTPEGQIGLSKKLLTSSRDVDTLVGNEKQNAGLRTRVCKFQDTLSRSCV